MLQCAIIQFRPRGDTQMEYEIRCKVYPGQFSSEYSIEGDQSAGRSFSLFAPVHKVEVDEPPTRDHPVDGWLKVRLWDLMGSNAVVQLPRESFESGLYVTVNVGQFKYPPQPAELYQE